ncbi:MAG: YHS domain-containing protein [Chloroflexota bacterium]
MPLVFEYARATLAAGAVLLSPEELRDHVYERYLAPPDGAWFPLGEDHGGDPDDLDRLDPVCLMDVDPATARHSAEYGGRTMVFCAPACRKLFLAGPFCLPGGLTPRRNPQS